MIRELNEINITRRTVFLVIEAQIDFTRPYGKFGINGAEAIREINKIMAGKPYVVTTVDWHSLKPKPHISFKRWGQHCVPGTSGAMYDPDLDIGRIDVEFKKGTDPDDDIYDSFKIPWFEQFIKILDPDKVIVAGSAIPVCPSLTAMSSVVAGFETYLPWNACCVMKDTDIGKAIVELERAGVIVTNKPK
ncbi:MAG: isochorismatase family protein [Candidatus Nealsonbacteria bacterium]|nr:isochorismatase family protein [Candidatus Nealsonbacteria bacterium]